VTYDAYVDNIGCIGTGYPSRAAAVRAARETVQKCARAINHYTVFETGRGELVAEGSVRGEGPDPTRQRD